VSKGRSRIIHVHEPLLILQHPGGGPLKIALGTHENRKDLWFEHTVTTQRGSSGSPCFDSGFELVGLHRGYEIKNQAVDLAAFAGFIPIS